MAVAAFRRRILAGVHGGNAGRDSVRSQGYGHLIGHEHIVKIAKTEFIRACCAYHHLYFLMACQSFFSGNYGLWVLSFTAVCIIESVYCTYHDALA